ncbi:MAG: hypothetical protein KKA07_04335 [Bacteroidetes bacterium]|nr:hypothetical protein [Bacteroidota bacterium]MBU1718280.1 hypothetical protein [Bacteroidota bacterium]
MKNKIFALSGLVSMILFLFACSGGVTTDDAVKYNDQIIEHQVKIVKKLDALDNTLSTYVLADMNAALSAAKEQTDQGIKAVEAMGEFDGSTAFRDAGLDFFKVVQKMIETEYPEVVKLMSLSEEDYDDEANNRVMELADVMDSSLKGAMEAFSKAQDDFAAKYNFSLVEKDFN